MDLAELTDQPTTVTVAGKDFRFSELTVELAARLQQWIKANVPHPLDVIRPHLAGFTPEQQAELLTQARKEAAYWPPAVGTGEAAVVLASTPAGLVETLYVGLLIHQPDATRKDAEWLYRRIRQDAKTSATILGLIYGVQKTSDDEGETDPKAEAAANGAVRPSTGP